MSAVSFIEKVARRLLIQNQPKGIITIPNRMTTEAKAGEIAATFQKAGLPVERFDEFITSEADVVRLLNQIKAFEKKRMAESMEVISQDDPRFKGIMSKMMGSNVIKRDFGKPFKEEIKKMKSDEEILSNIKKSNERSVQNLRMQMMDDKVANDMFQGGPSRDPKTDADMLAEFIAEDAGKVYDDLPTKERLKFYDRAYNAIMRYKRKDSEDMADGGRIGFNTGSGLPLDPMDPDNKLNAVINAFKKLSPRSQNRIGFKKFFEIYARENFADGGRIGFKMGRRAFLKALGAGIGGAAAIKTGIIGLGAKKAVTGAGEKIITAPVKGKPEWFDALVNKVIREGDDVTKQFSTKEREIVHKLDIDNLDDVRVTQDLDQGIVKVEYNSPNNMGEDTVELVFKSGRGQMDETTGKVADEFYAVEKEPRAVGGPEDSDLEFDGENLVRSVDDLQSDTSKLKEVATGKKQTLSEFVNSKKKKDKVKQINEDQVEQAEYLEQKYGPYERYLDEDVDADFASGGLAGMLGQ